MGGAAVRAVVVVRVVVPAAKGLNAVDVACCRGGCCCCWSGEPPAPPALPFTPSLFSGPPSVSKLADATGELANTLGRTGEWGGDWGTLLGKGDWKSIGKGN